MITQGSILRMVVRVSSLWEMRKEQSLLLGRSQEGQKCCRYWPLWGGFNVGMVGGVTARGSGNMAGPGSWSGWLAATICYKELNKPWLVLPVVRVLVPDQEVLGSVPGQGMYLGCRISTPSQGGCGRQPIDVSLSH